MKSDVYNGKEMVSSIGYGIEINLIRKNDKDRGNWYAYDVEYVVTEFHALLSYRTIYLDHELNRDMCDSYTLANLVIEGGTHYHLEIDEDFGFIENFVCKDVIIG